MPGIKTLAVAGLLLSVVISPSLSYPPFDSEENVDYPSFENGEKEEMETPHGIIMHIGQVTSLDIILLL